MRPILIVMLFATACHETAEPRPAPSPLEQLEVAPPPPPPQPIRDDVLDAPERAEVYKGCMLYCVGEPPSIDRTMPLAQCQRANQTCDQDPIWETRQ